MSFFDFLTKKTPVKAKKEKPLKNQTQPPEEETSVDQKKSSGYGKHVTEYHPRSFDDVADIIDCLTAGKPALVYLTEVRDNTSQRVLDILSGAIYALNGSVAEMSDEIYVFTPDARV